LRTGSSQDKTTGCDTQCTTQKCTFAERIVQIGLARAGSPIPRTKQYGVQLLWLRTPTAHKIT